jgi:hypothetical protein
MQMKQNGECSVAGAPGGETQASGLDEKVATNNVASKHQDRALAIEPADGLGGRQRAVRMSSGV